MKTLRDALSSIERNPWSKNPWVFEANIPWIYGSKTPGSMDQRPLDLWSKDPWIYGAKTPESMEQRPLDLWSKDPWIYGAKTPGSMEQRSLDLWSKDPWIYGAKIPGSIPRSTNRKVADKSSIQGSLPITRLCIAPHTFKTLL